MSQPALLSSLPEHMRLAIAEAVAQPTPPPKWLDLGLAQIVSRAWREWYRQRGLKVPDERRVRTPRWMREYVIQRDGLICALCGGEVPPDDVHVDHVVPLSLGGPTAPENLQVAHSRCNILKGARA